MMITLMATTLSPNLHTAPLLEGWRVNMTAVLSLRDMEAFPVTIEVNGRQEVIISPICEVRLPNMILYASGVADELLARAR